MRRSGAALALVAALALLGGGALALDRVLRRPVITVVLTAPPRSLPADQEAVNQALREGLELACHEEGWRAGRFKVRIGETVIDSGGSFPSVSIDPVLWFPAIFGFTVRGAEGSLGLLRQPLQSFDEKTAAADLIGRIGARSVFMVSSIWGFEEDGHQRFLGRARDLDVDVVGIELDTSLTHRPATLATEVVRRRPDAVYLDVSGEGAVYVRALRAAGFEGSIVISGCSLCDGFSEEGVRLFGSFRPPMPQDFIRRFTARFGRLPRPLAWESYQAGQAQLEAWSQGRSMSEGDLLPFHTDAYEEGPDLPAAAYQVREGRLVPLSEPP